jgi:hypothetical protein
VNLAFQYVYVFENFVDIISKSLSITVASHTCAAMPIASCFLPLAYFLLPIAYCFLPIAYCPLPIVFLPTKPSTSTPVT